MKQSATRYRCAFSFKYGKKKRAGTVTVEANAGDAATATVKAAKKS